MVDVSEFDKFAEEYQQLHSRNIRLSGESPEYFAEYKIKAIRDLMAERHSTIAAILDFGAGVGNSVPYFKRYFPAAALTCVDVSEQSLRIATTRFPDAADYRVFDGQVLPFPTATFDLVFAACVFHHIPHDLHGGLLREWWRVLKPGGTAVIFEHNPFNPLTRHAVNTCPFDENAVLITPGAMSRAMRGAGFQRAALSYRIFVPGALRLLRPLERWLVWCPLGAQYMAYASKHEA
jgi:SAM-dependent methyltransferase